MRKIGDVASSAFEIERVLVEKRIEFGDKRGDFVRLRAGYPLALCRCGRAASPRSAATAAVTQAGPEAGRRRSERQREDAKRQRDRGHGFAQRTFERVPGSRGGDDNASVLEAEPLRANAQRLVARTYSVEP